VSHRYERSPFARLEELRDESDARGLFGVPLRDKEKEAIERARLDCGVCDRGSVSEKATTHHNLRCAEFGERSYPCTKGRA
jgi:hypothetical protein